MMESVREPHPSQHPARLLGGDGHRLTGDQQRHGGVLQRAELGEQVVELVDEPQLPVAEPGLGTAVPAMDILPLEQHGAAGGVVERPHQVQQGGLARTRATHHRQHLPRGDGQVDPLEHLGLQIAFLVDMVEGLAAQQRLAGLGLIHTGGSTCTRNYAGNHTGCHNRR